MDFSIFTDAMEIIGGQKVRKRTESSDFLFPVHFRHPCTGDDVSGFTNRPEDADDIIYLISRFHK